MRLTEGETKILKDEFDYIGNTGRYIPFDNEHIKSWQYSFNSINSLIRKNIIYTTITDKGETFYRLTDLGISIVNLLGGNNK